MNPTQSTKYRADIDGLRAIAVSSVVLFHAFPEYFTGGFVGVDIFFVISGYLISKIIFAGLDSSEFSFLDFYSRRIKRIFPALGLVLLSTLTFGYFSLFSDEYKNLGKQTVAGIFFYSNFSFLKDLADYFNPISEQKPLLHLWSLGIEEQFYIVWPFLLYLVWKLKLNSKLLLITSILAVISFTWNITEIYSNPVFAFYLPFTRVWELFLGSILAWFHLYKQNRLELFVSEFRLFAFQNKYPNLLFNIQSILGLLLIIAGVFLIPKSSTFPGFFALIPVFGAFFIISAGEKAWVNNRILKNPILIYIGLISFPLYLWHWPLLSFSNILESGTPTIEIRLTSILLSIAFSHITWKFVEGKIRFRSEKWVTASLALFLILIGLVGQKIKNEDGWKFRGVQFEAPNNDYQIWFFDQKNCINEFKSLLGAGITYCSRNSSGPSPTIALIGDSHSEHFFYGLSQYFRNQHNENLLNLGISACPILSGLSRNSNYDCSDSKDILEYVVKTPAIKKVLLSGRGPIYLTGKGFGEIENHLNYEISYTLDPTIKDYKVIYKTSLMETVRKLTNSHKEVILISDNPELGFDPKACGNPRPFRLSNNNIKSPCAVSKKEFEARNKDYHKILKEVSESFPNGLVKIWEPWKKLCDEEWCWAVKDGQLLYRDTHHLNENGSYWLGTRYDLK
ncbi:acyltransferase family protein [Leptospira koniambonensis]|uniref:acyltransferase family protein n=1 Tax=Leptospira koniambonensis TaxID=2484950 RepID=UPI003EBBF9A7